MVEFVMDTTVERIDSWGSDGLIARAAWICTGLDRQGDVAVHRVLHQLMSRGHGTPFEQAGLTFRIIAPVYVLRQIMRHRIASWNERSLRYTAQGGQYYIGTHWPEVLQDAVKVTSESADATYRAMLEKGVKREYARALLPFNTMSTVQLSINVRSLLNFLAQRTSQHAQWETRSLALKIEKYAADSFPLTLGAFDKCGRKAP
jgi:thymidylate synthase (FAD)